jgi:hypothetical protein
MSSGVIVLAITVLSVIIEITPIKFNPISLIGKVVNKDLMTEIKKVNTKVDGLETKLDNHIVMSYRDDILQFQDKLLNYPNRTYTMEVWNHIMSSCDAYDKYVTDNHISNGQVTEAIIFIKGCHQKALDERRITNLKGDAA